MLMKRDHGRHCRRHATPYSRSTDENGIAEHPAACTQRMYQRHAFRAFCNFDREKQRLHLRTIRTRHRWRLKGGGGEKEITPQPLRRARVRRLKGAEGLRVDVVRCREFVEFEWR